MRSIF